MTDELAVSVNLAFDHTSVDSTGPPPPEIFTAKDVSFYYGATKAITDVTLNITSAR